MCHRGQTSRAENTSRYLKLSFMKFALIIFAVITSSISLQAQSMPRNIVRAKPNALVNVPVDKKKKLVERMSQYLYYLQTKDLKKLYELVTIRTRSGLSKEEFIKVSKVETEGNIIWFRIEKVQKAKLDQYSDEPPPQPGEGEKWFVTGIEKRMDLKGKTQKFDVGYDVWLTNGEWYINRGGKLLIGIE